MDFLDISKSVRAKLVVNAESLAADTHARTCAEALPLLESILHCFYGGLSSLKDISFFFVRRDLFGFNSLLSASFSFFLSEC